MFMRNVNFDTGIVNGKQGVVRAISPRIVDVKIIAPDSPLIKIPRILFEAKVGSKGITFHRRQFPLRVCYAVTVNKSQGQTLSTVGLDLRDDVFCHGQLYVALSRTTCSANIVCLVRPERLINGVPHVANCVFEPFITAATGLGLPQFSPLFYRPPLLPYAVTSAQLPPSRHPPDNGWNIVDEVGDVACLLRTIARQVFGNPELHPQVRSEIVLHIEQNSQQYIMHISNGFGNEPIHMLGSVPRTYHNLQDYLQIMSRPNAYAGYINIAAAIPLYNIAINITFSGSSLPSFPINPSHLHILYQPNSMHYSTLLPLNDDIIS